MALDLLASSCAKPITKSFCSDPIAGLMPREYREGTIKPEEINGKPNPGVLSPCASFINVSDIAPAMIRVAHSQLPLCLANQFAESHPQCTRQRVGNLYPHAALAEFDGASSPGP